MGEGNRGLRDCGTENPPGAKFCNECAKELPRPTLGPCPKCGAMNALVQDEFPWSFSRDLGKS